MRVLFAKAKRDSNLQATPLHNCRAETKSNPQLQHSLGVDEPAIHGTAFPHQLLPIETLAREQRLWKGFPTRASGGIVTTAPSPVKSTQADLE
jgi:hypothetical protein